ncbi:MAG: h16 [Firmicutes bacterium]|nr:h16 [Bacillota bacterium]
MKKICIEEHWGTEALGRLRREWTNQNGFPEVLPLEHVASVMPRLADFDKFRLPEMDQYNIALQVLSLPPVPQGYDTALARELNDFQAEVVKKHPNRFAGFAILPMHNPKAAADELERAVKKLGFKGAMVGGHINGEYLDEKQYWVIWERAEGLGVPLYLHPNEPLPDQIKIYKDHHELLGPTWNWGVETATIALRIVFSGVFDAFPKATLILGHLGEMLPYVLCRLDGRWRVAKHGKSLQKNPSEYVKENMLITTSGHFSPESLKCAISVMGSDRILFSVDYPMESIQEAVKFIETAPISEEDRSKICYQNAERLFGL